MKLAEAVGYIKAQLTGNEVDCEVSDSVIQSFLEQAFLKVRSWYEEPPKTETLKVEGTDDFRYVPKSAFSSSPHVIHGFYPITQTSSILGTAEAGLMGLSGYRELGDEAESAIFALQLSTHMDVFYNVRPEFREVGDRFLLAGKSVSAGDYVTVIYSPFPASFEEMTDQRAISWALRWATAKTAIALGRVRSKWEGGDIELSTDGRDLISEATQEITTLEEMLPNLDYQICAVR